MLVLVSNQRNPLTISVAKGINERAKTTIDSLRDWLSAKALNPENTTINESVRRVKLGLSKTYKPVVVRTGI